MTGEMGFPAGAPVHTSLPCASLPIPVELPGFSLPTRPAASAVLRAGTVGASLIAVNWHQAKFYLPPLLVAEAWEGKLSMGVIQGL